MTLTDVLTTANFQILHPAPEERLQTVTEIKKSRIFDGVYVPIALLSFHQALFLLMIFKETGRKWHAERYIHHAYLNLCGKAKWRGLLFSFCSNCLDISASITLVQMHRADCTFNHSAASLL